MVVGEFKVIKYEFFCFEFLMLFIIKNWNEKVNFCEVCLCMGCVGYIFLFFNNVDGESIVSFVLLFFGCLEDRKIMFVLSDGVLWVVGRGFDVYLCLVVK